MSPPPGQARCYRLRRGAARGRPGHPPATHGTALGLRSPRPLRPDMPSTKTADTAPKDILAAAHAWARLEAGGDQRRSARRRRAGAAETSDTEQALPAVPAAASASADPGSLSHRGLFRGDRAAFHRRSRRRRSADPSRPRDRYGVLHPDASLWPHRAVEHLRAHASDRQQRTGPVFRGRARRSESLRARGLALWPAAPPRGRDHRPRPMAFGLRRRRSLLPDSLLRDGRTRAHGEVLDRQPAAASTSRNTRLPAAPLQVPLGRRRGPVRTTRADEPVKLSEPEKGAEAMSSTNAALARRWFEEVWNRRRTETIDELLDPEGVVTSRGKRHEGPSSSRFGSRGAPGSFPGPLWRSWPPHPR